MMMLTMLISFGSLLTTSYGEGVDITPGFDHRKYNRFQIETLASCGAHVKGVSNFVVYHAMKYERSAVLFNDEKPTLVLIKRHYGTDKPDDQTRIPIEHKSVEEIMQILAENGFVPTLPGMDGKLPPKITPKNTETLTTEDTKTTSPTPSQSMTNLAENTLSKEDQMKEENVDSGSKQAISFTSVKKEEL